MGRVFDIQRFSTHDGPGIRTTVFLKGCPLRCAWCHNPESQAAGPELFLTPSLCIDCGACDEACREGIARDVRGRAPACLGCLRCAEVCPTGAIERVGREMSVGEVIDEAQRDRIFYETSGGGVTLSGGEPLAQAEFALDLLQLARKRGLHTCVETSGVGDRRALLRLVPFVDLFLWDIKDTDPARLRLHTGAHPYRGEKRTRTSSMRVRENATSHRSASACRDLRGANLHTVLRNLEAVDAAGGRTLLRCIMLPGVNMNAPHIAAIGAIWRRLHHSQGVELLPFHPFGASKHERLGRGLPPVIAGLAEPDTSAIDQARTQLECEGVTCLHEGAGRVEP